MADTTFVSGTVITSEWLNELNKLAHKNFVIADYHSNINTALTIAATRGIGVWLTPNTTYTLEDAVIYPAVNRIGLISDGTANIYAPASVFSNTTPSQYLLDTSCVVQINGLLSGALTPLDHPYLVGVRITSEVSDGRRVDAVGINNVRYPILDNVTIKDFPLGVDINMSTVVGGTLSRIKLLGRGTTHPWATQQQITGITIDDNRVGGVGSYGTAIIAPEIYNMTMTGQLLSSSDHQTDGIHIAHQFTRGIRIISPYIQNVGEGIDIFGDYNQISDPVIRQARQHGIKLIHGASFNKISSPIIEDVGLAGIVFGGSGIYLDSPTNTLPVGDTERNRVSNAIITNLDYLNVNSGGNGAISFQINNGTTGLARKNFIDGADISLGEYGRRGWHDFNTVDTKNHGKNIEVTPGAAMVARATIVATSGGCSPAIPTNVSVHRTAVQSIPDNTPTKIQFNATTLDERGEYDSTTNYRWTAQHPGMYRIKWQTRFAAVGAAGDLVVCYIYRNGSVVAVNANRAAETSDISFGVDSVIKCVAGDYIEAFITQVTTASRNTTAGAEYTFMNIQEA